MHCLWDALFVKCTVYEMHCLWDALFVKCTVYEMHCLWDALFVKCTVYEMHCLLNALFMRCTVYEMRCLLNALFARFGVKLPCVATTPSFLSSFLSQRGTLISTTGVIWWSTPETTIPWEWVCDCLSSKTFSSLWFIWYIYIISFFAVSFSDMGLLRVQNYRIFWHPLLYPSQEERADHSATCVPPQYHGGSVVDWYQVVRRWSM